nr:hypothetical protein BaRGS_008319 [Batillaria attramentaria]KAG5693810.1 hypothetical protein BaRGS_029440 [Batillaria attramentaria]
MRQIQGLVYMLVAQKITQPLPLAEQGLPTGCTTGNSSIPEDFTPQDWTDREKEAEKENLYTVQGMHFSAKASEL